MPRQIDPIARLRAAIQRDGRTQEAIAAELGVTRMVLAHVIHERRRPTLELAAGLQRLYRIPMEAWVRRG